jgi:hypothetical protein
LQWLADNAAPQDSYRGQLAESASETEPGNYPFGGSINPRCGDASATIACCVGRDFTAEDFATMRLSKTIIASAIIALAAGAATAQSVRIGPDGGFSFKFGRDDRRGDVEGKRASCEVYSRIAVVQADANRRFRCGLRGPAWNNDPGPHFQWCRFVPRQRIAEEQRNRSQDLQRCFDRLGDFDDDKWGR